MAKYYVISEDGVTQAYDDLTEAWAMAIMVENTYFLDRKSRTWGVSFFNELSQEIDLQFYFSEPAVPPEIQTKALLLL